ncbi:MAG TPA: hypothetical protein DCR69_02980 [Clostridium sp.]|nr:hypothetical protein [Clostridium sp.]
MKVPYMRLKQKGEIFYIAKFNVLELKEYIDFHFRDPYLGNKKDIEKVDDYVKKLERKGIEMNFVEDGIQRRLQLGRINDIKNYIESNVSNFIPNTIILSADVSDLDGFEEDYLKYETQEIGYFNFPPNIKFSVIDGQHRLAGLFISDEKLIRDMEVSAVLLFNISISTAAKLFLDINGNQKQVNKSLIYDIYEVIDDKDIEEIKKFHEICQQFYSDPASPLYKQIKMLGIGNGAISQAFFIDYVMKAVKDTDLYYGDAQEIYEQLFYYFNVFQRVFSDDWPILEDCNSEVEQVEHANYVLKIRKSQLLKTNGFGAIMNIFPEVYRKTNGDYNEYYNLINKLRNNISWVPDTEKPHGTGKAFQNYLRDLMLEILFS